MNRSPGLLLLFKETPVPNPRGVVYAGPNGVKLIIDVQDPDTPAIVELHNCTATYHCATDTGELDGARDYRVLTDAQLKWLAGFEEKVAAAYSEARRGNPRYS